MSDAIHWMTLREVSDRIRTRDLRSVDVTEHMLERIERLNPIYASYATVTADAALEAARQADAEIDSGKHRGVLQGVPIAVKDLCDTEGIPTAAGMKVLRDNVPTTDATVVTRLKDAGAVLLGKLTMTEGASGAHHPDIEAPGNPWNLDYWVGASSSGSGSATAAGLCFGSLGSDTAGSIRFPSACCGLAGIKPTYGRVSRAGVFPLSATLDHVGPMTRSVGDAAAMLAVISGADDRDTTSSLQPIPDLEGALAQGVEGLRIGHDPAYSALAASPSSSLSLGESPDTALALERTLEALRDAGAETVDALMPDTSQAMEHFGTIFHADIARTHLEAGMFPENEDQYGPHLKEIIEIGRGMTAVDYARAQEGRLAFAGELARLFSDIDLLLCPAMPGLPPPVRSLVGSGDFRGSRSLAFTAPFDLSGSPTLTQRAGFSENGLPVAVQLVGRPFEEEMLIRAGAQVESRMPGNDRVPADPA